MKKLIFTTVFAFVFWNFAHSQNVWVPASTVLNSGSPTNVGIGTPSPTSTLEVIGSDVHFEGNHFRSGTGNAINGGMLNGALGQDNTLNDCQYSFGLGSTNLLTETYSCVALGGGITLVLIVMNP